jgi:ATP-dependent helicase/nuclease subunit B
MRDFLARITALARDHVTRNKWVIVPSHAIGRTLGERIALDGTNWLNLRLATPLDLALRMGAPFLVERGIDPSEAGLGPALIMRLLHDLGEGGYFRPLAGQPAMAHALWTTIREFRMAGLKSGALHAQAFESPVKHAELQALVAAYERHLVENRRGDLATVYEEALDHRDWCPIQDEDCWTELPETPWAPLQIRLLDRLPGEHVVPRSVSVSGISLPRRFDRRVERCDPDPETSPLAFLMTPSTTPRSGVDLFHAGGREAEIEEIFRRILARGVPLDQVEIACASEAHLSLVWEKALRREWPITLGPGLPASATRPGRAVLGFCDWIETDFSAAHLRRLLESGDMGIDASDEGFTAGQAARTLARAEAGWGRATYGLSLARLEKSQSTRADDPDLSDEEREAARRRAARTGRVRDWIATLIASVPAEAAGRVALDDVIEAVLAFIDRSTARASQLDHRSAAALADHVAELRSLGPFACPLRDALRFVRERVESLDVAPDRPRPGHLYACRLQQAAWSGRAHLFVAGLDEGQVFPAAAEDPVLLDAERAAISPNLRRSTDRIDEAVYVTLARLAGWQREAGARVTFSYSTRDTREFRETYASWLVLQAFRLQQGHARASYRDMKTALGEPVSCVPRDRGLASTRSAWWLASVAGTGGRGAEVVEAAFAPLARGRRAALARASDRFTEYDGRVGIAGAVLDPCAPGNAFSVTELESAAGCPFRFFLKRGLGVRPPETRERDRDVWLDALTRGAKLHDIYAALLRRCRAGGRRPDPGKDGAWLRAYAQAVLDRLNREMPAATAEILDRETRDFLADVDLFLEVEADSRGADPIGLEVSFGRAIEDDAEDLAREAAVEIDLGGGRRLHYAGRIDRIDRIGPSEFQIVDYKTGGFWRPEWRGIFKGGRRLQHALYGLAAVELLRARHRAPKVTKAIYYFSSHKGRGERVVIPAPSRRALVAVLGDLRDVIASGAFVHASDESACRFCDYAAACEPAVLEQAANKAGDPALAPFVRLAAHD